MFRTAFRRGGKFRFAFRKSFYGRPYGEALILWYDGQRALVSNFDTGKFEKEESLGLAIAGFTGISSSTAHHIPRLLMPTMISGRRIVDMTALQPPSEESLGKDVCYRQEGKVEGDKAVLWIKADSFLVVKIEEHMGVDGRSKVKTTKYSFTMGEELPNALFQQQNEGEWEELELPEPN